MLKSILILIGIWFLIKWIWSPNIEKTPEGHILLFYKKNKYKRDYIIIYWNKQ